MIIIIKFGVMLKEKKKIIKVPRRHLVLNGDYRVSRMTDFDLEFNSNGFIIDGLESMGIGMTFSQNQINVYNYITGGTSLTVDIPGSLDLTRMWDEVMMEQVCIIMASRTRDPVNSNTANSCPVLTIANCTDGIKNTTIDIVNQLHGAATWHATSDNEMYRWNVRPSYLREVFLAKPNAAGEPPVMTLEPARGFIKTGSNVPQYGTRIAMGNNRQGLGAIKFTINLIFHCRNTI